MLEGEEQGSAYTSESTTEDNVVDQSSDGGAKTIPEAKNLINRRGKIVNGYINNKNKKIVRGQRRDQIGAYNEKHKMRSSDSGLGMTSTIEGDSSSTERGSESGQEGMGRAAVVAKREDMARLEKELEQEMRYR